MRETKSKEIGGVTYTFTQLGAIKGRKVCARLAKVLATTVNGQLPQISEEDVDYFCDTYAPLTSVTIEGKSPQLDKIFDTHFAGKYDEMMQWLWFCLETDFGSFFRKAGDVAAVQAAAASPLISPKEPTG